jgi:hypothetical protein
MWIELWAVACGVLGLAVGYAVGRRQEREALREAAERAALTERDESGRTPGQPTNRRGPSATIRVGKWRDLRMTDGEVQD